ncbi:NrfD/PsrC family molybdoenzyme membrane anchor subunit [Robiginitalea aurantiaca]|uniref:Polysulfide reductase NrfD n=1 Tax=Robiginitalea aurantiaca TaxID=3056915 RepID=A0ABT7WGP7_9FLAO|nr:NrfD/PsrC family molybdoenzyme membrane anchor subunit [Robiginitalea aurantiaca]MDM9632091.1 polysulfide reductase NrfD [Robiginitalea aurantiaca]
MSKYDQLIKDLGPRKFSLKGKLWVALLLAVTVAGIIAYVDQLIRGQVVTNMRDYVLWGLYISNFVFFVATSFVAALVVAALRLTKNEWRRPFVRMAQIVALACIIMAGITIIIDMARPDRMMNLFIHARLQSPITWDVIIIPTFIVVSLLLLYFPLIPDLAILRDHYSGTNKKLSKIYGFFAMKWRWSQQQINLQGKSIHLLVLMIIPLGLILESIDAYLFSTTYRVGWNSTNFGPYFISGAMVSGLGALITVVYIVRKNKQLENYITEYHFDKIGKLFNLTCLIYVYFNINEYLVPLFTAKKGESEHLETLLRGEFAIPFWIVTLVGLVFPAILLIFKRFRKPRPLYLIAIVVVLGAYWKRYLIVTPTLLHPYLPIQGVPENWHYYFPSVHEWLITGATLAMALLIITLLIRYVPVISIDRLAEEEAERLTSEKKAAA